MKIKILKINFTGPILRINNLQDIRDPGCSTNFPVSCSNPPEAEGRTANGGGGGLSHLHKVSTASWLATAWAGLFASTLGLLAEEKGCPIKLNATKRCWPSGRALAQHIWGRTRLARTVQLVPDGPKSDIKTGWSSSVA